MKRLIPLWMILFLLPACQKSIRPGAIDPLDSKTYDALLISQAVLDNTKVAILQGKLPESAKEICNSAGKAYDALREAWLLYRAGPNPITAQKIADASVRLSAFIAQLRGLGVQP